MARHRLVFVQLGAAHLPLKEYMFSEMGGSIVTPGDVIAGGVPEGGGVLVVDALEQLTRPGSIDETFSLGVLRERVISLMDQGWNVCLVSRAPRVAFGSVPGSSLLEDAALWKLPLLGAEECGQSMQSEAGWQLPAFLGTDGATLVDVFEQVLEDLGLGVLGALEHVLFEVDPRGLGGLPFLSNRDAEALQGAGVLTLDANKQLALAVPQRLSPLKEALAAHLSEAVVPPSDFQSIVTNLWFVERTIRAAVRRKAIETDGQRWRGTVVSGGLGVEVLRRARLDTNVTALSIKELRDPLEWLTLGELLDIVNSSKMAHLGIDPVVWRKFAEQVLPVRNRLSHMRMLRSGDEEVVSMWAGVMRQSFAQSVPSRR